MKVLVCGGRNWIFPLAIRAELDKLRTYVRDELKQELCIVQGGAAGVDTIAREWCCETGTACITVSANWNAFGKSAGAIRNAWMLKFTTPDAVLAFPGGRGTQSMIDLAMKQGCPVWRKYNAT